MIILKYFTFFMPRYKLKFTRHDFMDAGTTEREANKTREWIRNLRLRKEREDERKTQYIPFCSDSRSPRFLRPCHPKNSPETQEFGYKRTGCDARLNTISSSSCFFFWYWVLTVSSFRPIASLPLTNFLQTSSYNSLSTCFVQQWPSASSWLEWRHLQWSPTTATDWWCHVWFLASSWVAFVCHQEGIFPLDLTTHGENELRMSFDW